MKIGKALPPLALSMRLQELVTAAQCLLWPCHDEVADSQQSSDIVSGDRMHNRLSMEEQTSGVARTIRIF